MSLQSLTVAFLAFPALSLAATPASHLGFQGNAVFLAVATEEGKSVVHTMHAKVKEDEAQGAHSGLLMGIVGLYVPNLPGFLMMLEYMPHKQGLFFGLFLALLILAAYAAARAWNNAFPEEDDEDSAEHITTARGLTSDKFEELCDKGELDFYTCMALSLGHHKNWAAFAKFIPKLIILLSLQVVLPVMLMTYQTRRGVGLPTEQNHTYRTLGAMLFAFSAWHLHQGMEDECRTAVVNMMFKRHVSGWYAWPILFGEAMSTFVATTLIFILFLIFADCTRPQDLLINCIAINFVVDIDNHLVSDRDSTVAAKFFSEFLAEWKESLRFADVVNKTPSRKSYADNFIPPSKMAAGTASVQRALLHTNDGIRFLVPILAGIFTFLFAFANNDSVCHYMRALEPFPFCHNSLED